ncbi:MAG: hypothetical protein ACFFAH_15905 [Promethearchaeota archaeon]
MIFEIECFLFLFVTFEYYLGFYKALILSYIVIVLVIVLTGLLIEHFEQKTYLGVVKSSKDSINLNDGQIIDIFMGKLLISEKELIISINKSVFRFTRTQNTNLLEMVILVCYFFFDSFYFYSKSSTFIRIIL